MYFTNCIWVLRSNQGDAYGFRPISFYTAAPNLSSIPTKSKGERAREFNGIVQHRAVWKLLFYSDDKSMIDAPGNARKERSSAFSCRRFWCGFNWLPIIEFFLACCSIGLWNEMLYSKIWQVAVEVDQRFGWCCYSSASRFRCIKVFIYALDRWKIFF